MGKNDAQQQPEDEKETDRVERDKKKSGSRQASEDEKETQQWEKEKKEKEKE